MAVDPLPTPDGRDQEKNTQHRALQGFARPYESQIQAHQKRDGDGGSDREDSPGTFREHLHDHESEHRQQDDHDGQDGHQGECSQEGIQFVLHHLPQ